MTRVVENSCSEDSSLVISQSRRGKKSPVNGKEDLTPCVLVNLCCIVMILADSEGSIFQHKAWYTHCQGLAFFSKASFVFLMNNSF